MPDTVILRPAIAADLPALRALWGRCGLHPSRSNTDARLSSLIAFAGGLFLVAEDGNGWILRLFEAEGTACRCRLDFGGTPCRIEQTNLLEETEALLLERGTQLDLTLRAFGIVTLRCQNA